MILAYMTCVWIEQQFLFVFLRLCGPGSVCFVLCCKVLLGMGLQMIIGFIQYHSCLLAQRGYWKKTTLPPPTATRREPYDLTPIGHSSLQQHLQAHCPVPVSRWTYSKWSDQLKRPLDFILFFPFDLSFPLFMLHHLILILIVFQDCSSLNPNKRKSVFFWPLSFRRCHSSTGTSWVYFDLKYWHFREVSFSAAIMWSAALSWSGHIWWFS